MRSLKRSIKRATGRMHVHYPDGRVKTLRDWYAPNPEPIQSHPGPGWRARQKKVRLDYCLGPLPGKAARRVKILRRRLEKGESVEIRAN